MGLALSIVGSTFLLGLIAAHIPKFSRTFDESALSVLPLFYGSRWITDFVDPPARHVGGLRRGFAVLLFYRLSARQPQLDQAADGFG
jgi:hypothetical protein